LAVRLGKFGVLKWGCSKINQVLKQAQMKAGFFCLPVPHLPAFSCFLERKGNHAEISHSGDREFADHRDTVGVAMGGFG
jgi:hypothetical protein